MSEVRHVRWHDGVFVNNAAEREATQMSRKSCHAGLDDRCRDSDGTIRQKNGNTRVHTLRDIYGPTFASGARGDMKLETLLHRSGANSLTDYRKKRG